MNRHILNSEATILEALDRLNGLSGSSMTLFVVDGDGVMTGTLTDGDVRRALLGGLALDAPAAMAVNRRFKALRPGQDGDTVAMLKSLREMGIILVPCLDRDGRIEDVIDLNKTYNRLPVSAVLMAGGKGERLRPLTLTRPKPLLEIAVSYTHLRAYETKANLVCRLLLATQTLCLPCTLRMPICRRACIRLR